MVEPVGAAQDDSCLVPRHPQGGYPRYQTAEGVTVRVTAGAGTGVGGAITREDTEPLYIVDLPAGSSFSTAFPAQHNALSMSTAARSR